MRERRVLMSVAWEWGRHSKSDCIDLRILIRMDVFAENARNFIKLEIHIECGNSHENRWSVRPFVEDSGGNEDDVLRWCLGK